MVEKTATMTTDFSNQNSDITQLKKQRAKARWSMLRNALLNNQEKPSSEHSIHRFSGYALLSQQQQQQQKDFGNLDETVLKRFTWNGNESTDDNIRRLEISILALASCFPKGSCIQICGCKAEKSREYVETVKGLCQSVAYVLVVDEESPSNSITLLIQETSSASTKYGVCQYNLDETCSLWTREPRETRLSLEHLVSHRTTGVDNTGNICVWDSERSLTFLLYHHIEDFPIDLAKTQNILELGTGMAGLAALSLGLRIAQTVSTEKVYITLTDGHSNGVKNNLINHHLTGAAYSTLSSPHHPYQSLIVTSQVLLWTTEIETNFCPLQDVVLVSDCTHFQNFHAALAVTMLRSLCRDGVAIFCQPDRSDSLNNFVELLMIPTDLVSLKWIKHPVIEREDKKASEEHKDVYDKNLHYPKILLIKKLRELTEQDRDEFVLHQQNRNKKE